MKQNKEKSKICPLPLFSSIVTGVGFGILTGNYLAFIIIGIGVGGIIMGTTQKDALLERR